MKICGDQHLCKFSGTRGRSLPGVVTFCFLQSFENIIVIYFNKVAVNIRLHEYGHQQVKLRKRDERL
jgi:hypothetical protein